MIEARKCTDEEKLKNTNMDYVIYFGGAKRYFTKKAIIELQTELKKLRVADVSGRSELLVCDFCGSSKLDDCGDGCYGCGECGHYPITN